MSDQADPPSPPAEGPAQNADEPIEPSSPGKSPSVIGLALVSALNIACVAFIVFHNTTHDNDSVATGEVERRAGNISLEPTKASLLAIASRIEGEILPAEASAAELTVASLPPDIDPVWTTATNSPIAGSKKANATDAEETQRWVQLGALSDPETAHSYWAKLQKKNKELLSDHQPTVVGPDQAGGSLYHLRVGPLAAVHAGHLCQDLQQAGQDCYCIGDEE